MFRSTTACIAGILILTSVASVADELREGLLGALRSVAKKDLEEYVSEPDNVGARRALVASAKGEDAAWAAMQLVMLNDESALVLEWWRSSSREKRMIALSCLMMISDRAPEAEVERFTTASKRFAVQEQRDRIEEIGVALRSLTEASSIVYAVMGDWNLGKHLQQIRRRAKGKGG